MATQAICNTKQEAGNRSVFLDWWEGTRTMTLPSREEKTITVNIQQFGAWVTAILGIMTIVAMFGGFLWGILRTQDDLHRLEKTVGTLQAEISNWKNLDSRMVSIETKLQMLIDERKDRQK